MRGMGRGHHRGRFSRSGDEESTERLKISDRRMLGWFVQQLGPHWPKVLVGATAMVLGSLAGLAPPYITGRLIVDGVMRDQQYHLLPQYIGLLIGAFFAATLLNAIRMNVMHILGQRFVYDLRVKLYAHLQRLSLSYFESNETGDIMSRVSNDVNTVEDMVVHGTDEVVSNILTIVGTIIILMYMNWRLALTGLWPLPIFVVSLIIFARYIRPLYRKIRDDLGDINAELQENIAGISVVKAFGREEHELERFRSWSHEYYQANVRAIWLWTTFFPFIGFLTSLSSVGVLWYGAGPSFYGPVGGLIRIYDMFNRALAALARIFQIFDEVPEIEDAPDAVALEQVAGDVLLEGVSFKYRTGEVVLKDITVHAEPGETVALVGRSGAGKTSVINLIPRFYDPLEGRVLVDGHDVREVTQQSLRQHIALVLQETFLFSGTAKANIGYGRTFLFSGTAKANIGYGRLDATDEEIIAAANAANAHQFIMELPDEYETQIGERGVKLSGGQKQRIAIARAILADPRILILDEATSLVDTEAEQEIQQALEGLMKGRTVFVIAHRLSTVRNADKIVVIEGGEIAEEADHETLMEQNGLYAEMYQRQFNLEDIWGADAAAEYHK